MTVEQPTSEADLERFVLFHDDVYAERSARWIASPAFHVPFLAGRSPFAVDRRMQAFVACQHGKIVARVLAMIDERYQRLWKEPVGHLSFFEALPGFSQATRQMIDVACRWLAEYGATAARAGMGALEFPFAVEDHETLPPCFLRQNPAYYQTLLKQADFETEKGLVDYRIRVTPERIAAWEGLVEAGRRNGFELVPLAALPEERRAREFLRAYNTPFLGHWGYSPWTEDELVVTFRAFEPFGMLEHSLVAYRAGEPMGSVWVQADASAMARLTPGRTLRAEEKVNFLGIGVLEPARGSGLNLAMAAHTYLEFARKGYEYVSYTLVLDDNWPSRRTAEKLGAQVCNNYLVYCRRLVRSCRPLA